jgi:hypothetical protein
MLALLLLAVVLPGIGVFVQAIKILGKTGTTVA